MISNPSKLDEEIFLRCPLTSEWVVDSDLCATLADSEINWLGYSHIGGVFKHVQPELPESGILACYGGCGRAYIHGKWREWKKGEVILAPAGNLLAFESQDEIGEPWQLAWIFFAPSNQVEHLMANSQVEIQELDASRLINSIHWITREIYGPSDPVALQALITLLSTELRRLVSTSPGDERLMRLWNRVNSNLDKNWNNQILARIACMSEEHLRRLCHKYHQMSPMARVFEFRMNRARNILASTNRKLDDIATTIGFSSVYSFSSSFKRWCGKSPSLWRQTIREHREKAGANGKMQTTPSQEFQSRDS